MRCELEAWHGDRTSDSLDSASEKTRNFRENIREARSRYDQEKAYLWYEKTGLEARFASYDSRSEAFQGSLPVTNDAEEAHQSAFVSLHLRFELDLTSGFRECLIGVTLFITETVVV